MITPIVMGTFILLVILLVRWVELPSYTKKFLPITGRSLPHKAQGTHPTSGLAGEPQAEPDASQQQRPGGDSPTPPTIFPGKLISGSERRDPAGPVPEYDRLLTAGSILESAPSGCVRRGEILFLLNPNLVRRV